MKRFLLTLVCFSPLLFSPSTSFSLDLIGPNGERALSYNRYGPISSVETLWGIASKLRPNRSVSIQQTLVAIYKLNPYAFNSGNINEIIAESIIEVPTLEFIRAQTDQEAIVLIHKYTRFKAVPQKSVAVPIKKKTQQVATAPVVASKIPAPENLVDKKQLTLLENKLEAQRKELDSINEQLVVVTENNQALKFKLQPLKDQIEALNDELANEASINNKLQKLVDDYQTQLDAVKARPFSGDGLFNELLRLITSSLSNLIITIISPLLLMLAIFVVMMRYNSKQFLAQQEKELAESTAILMEESGQFDALLTEDFQDKVEINFAEDDAELEVSPPANTVKDSHSATDESEGIDLTDITKHSDNDLVDISEEEEQKKVKSASNYQEEDEEDLISSVDLDDLEIISDSEQADLDLAAEWENQLAEETEEPLEKINDAADDIASSSLPEKEKSIAPPTDIVEEQSPDLEIIDLEELDLTDIDELTTSLAEDVVTEVDTEEREYDHADLLAKQMSEVAFNTEAPLPKVDINQEDKFIDIETLMEDSDQEKKDEPYSELDIDLGLDEFPDVINRAQGIDIDDDENGVAAQLDLARAYLEIDDKVGAKKILTSVVDKSKGAERAEIDKLLSRLG